VVPADSTWTTECIKGGLSSGEGLVHSIRDENSVDFGIADKRLCVIETEFAAVLKVMGRRGSTISELIRQAYDSDNLSILTKNNPCRASNPHVSLICHVTQADLIRHLESTDATNGFLNRFIFCWSKRSKLIPESVPIPQAQFESLAAGVAAAIAFAKRVGIMARDEAAKRLWDQRYEFLTSSHPGLLGSLSARGAAHVLRLSMICAAMDRSHYIRREHLEAALAIWDYARDTIRFVFGDALGDRVPDAILKHLRENPAGVGRTDIFNVVFHRNETSTRIEAALKLLASLRLAAPAIVSGSKGGRPAEVWVATDPRGTR
jgi:hypothetical protein